MTSNLQARIMANAKKIMQETQDKAERLRRIQAGTANVTEVMYNEELGKFREGVEREIQEFSAEAGFDKTNIQGQGHNEKDIKRWQRDPRRISWVVYELERKVSGSTGKEESEDDEIEVEAAPEEPDKPHDNLVSLDFSLPSLRALLDLDLETSLVSLDEKSAKKLQYKALIGTWVELKTTIESLCKEGGTFFYGDDPERKDDPEKKYARK